MITIGLNHKLAVLEIKGDWMEVELSETDITCCGGGAILQYLGIYITQPLV